MNGRVREVAAVARTRSEGGEEVGGGCLGRGGGVGGGWGCGEGVGGEGGGVGFWQVGGGGGWNLSPNKV